MTAGAVCDAPVPGHAIHRCALPVGHPGRHVVWAPRDADPPSYERLQGLVHLAEEVIGAVRAMVEDGHPVDPDWFRIVSQAVQRWEEA